MKNTRQSLRGALLAAPAALLLACGDSAVDPRAQLFLGCEVMGISIDQSVNGALSLGDCRVDGYLTDMYQLEVFSDQELIIDLESFDFDAYLVLYDRRTGQIIADNNDVIEGDLDARLAGFLPRGTYVIAASSFDVDEIGQYVLTVD